MVGKIREINKKISGDNMLTTALCLILITLGLVLRTAIPIVLMFIYVAVFNKRFTIALLITFPLYDAYFGSGWFSVNKIALVIFLIIFIFNISFKKISIGRYERIFMLITLVITFSYMVGMFNPLFLFIRDEFFVDYVTNIMPKIGFLVLFLLAVRSSDSYDIKEMIGAAADFIPFMVILITIISVTSMTGLNPRRNILMNVRPNFYSVFITCMVPFTVFAFFKKKNFLMNSAAVVSLACTAYLVSLTASRTGFVLLLVSFILSLILFTGKEYRKLTLMILLAVLGAAGSFLLPSFRDMVFRVLKLADTSKDFLPVRIGLLRSAWRIYCRNPILGYGGMKDSAAILIFEEMGLTKVSHNAYLDIGIQFGIAGILAFGTLYMSILWDFIRKLRARTREFVWQFPIYLIFINILLAGLVLSINFRDMHIYIIAVAAALPVTASGGKTICMDSFINSIRKYRILVVVTLVLAMAGGLAAGLTLMDTGYRSIIEIDETMTKKDLKAEVADYFDESLYEKFKTSNAFMTEFSLGMVFNEDSIKKVYEAWENEGAKPTFVEFEKGTSIDMRSTNNTDRLVVIYDSKEESEAVIDLIGREVLLEFDKLIKEGIEEELLFRKEKIIALEEKLAEDKLELYEEKIEKNKIFVDQLETTAGMSFVRLLENNMEVVEKGNELANNAVPLGVLAMVMTAIIWILVISAVQIFKEKGVRSGKT